MSEYGLKEYKALLERELLRLDDPNNTQFGLDPFCEMEINIRLAKQESINYAIEMMPSQFDIARHSKRLVERLKEELKQSRTNEARYEKLRRYMSSNVKDGWGKVENLGAIAAYLSWDDFDQYLDSLPECNVGLCEKSNEN